VAGAYICRGTLMGNEKERKSNSCPDHSLSREGTLGGGKQRITGKHLPDAMKLTLFTEDGVEVIMRKQGDH